MLLSVIQGLYFFFNDTATTEIYTLSLHDALPISDLRPWPWRTPILRVSVGRDRVSPSAAGLPADSLRARSEEHTSELQSRLHLVCRLLLEKKTKKLT